MALHSSFFFTFFFSSIFSTAQNIGGYDISPRYEPTSYDYTITHDIFTTHWLLKPPLGEVRHIGFPWAAGLAGTKGGERHGWAGGLVMGKELQSSKGEASLS